MTYDGADLAYVAERWGTDPDGVAARLGELELVSAFCGFAPGFAYLSGLPAELAVPRLDSPRSAVPAGSVALADTWCGVYPTASPGGWRLLGHTTLTLWDANQAEPALLAPGTRVRFRDASSLVLNPRVARMSRLDVLTAGGLTTVQDRGRVGLAHLGVPAPAHSTGRQPSWPTGWSATDPTRRSWR